MQLKEVIGRRRTIRFFLPFRPVERDKIQKMLEAARRASCVGNVMNVRGIVLWKDQASPELLKAITPPLGYQQMQTAPAFIFWYNDTAAYQIDKWIDDLHKLAESRRIGTDVEATKAQIDRGLRPAFAAAWQLAAVAPLAFMDVGQAIAQATLVAYDEGLSTCCMSSPRLEQVGKLLALPDTAVPVCLQAVGYAAEQWEAGGQTVKPPFESLFFEMRHGVPFTPDPAVDEELAREKMTMTPAPLPWREAELKYLMTALGLEERITAFPLPAAAPAGNSASVDATS
ncbi:MAG TPA: nitroreductase family protein [Dehalococcoidia bacterium]|nr:nitroreductase family protein [Dehalococcoidia bacterium]